MRIRVIAGNSCFDQSIGGRSRLIKETVESERKDEAGTNANVVVASAFELSAAELRPPLSLPELQICSAKRAFYAVRRRIRADRQNGPTTFGVRECLIDPARYPAQLCADIQTRQARVPDCARRLDQ